MVLAGRSCSSSGGGACVPDSQVFVPGGITPSLPGVQTPCDHLRSQLGDENGDAQLSSVETEISSSPFLREPSGKSSPSSLWSLWSLPALCAHPACDQDFFFLNLTHTTQFWVSKVYRLLQCTPCGREGSFALVLPLAGPLLREWSLTVTADYAVVPSLW